MGATQTGFATGFVAGGTIGLAGGPFDEVTVPGGAGVGGIIGTASGWTMGMAACRTGTGGGGSSGSGGSSSGGGTTKTWKLGSNKSATQWANQMRARGWTEAQINEAIEHGAQFPATNNINPANGATRFVSPTTGQSVVLDNATREVIHIGGPGFKY